MYAIADCGNQRCELGEACSTPACIGPGECARDCPVPLKTCPSSGTEVGIDTCLFVIYLSFTVVPCCDHYPILEGWSRDLCVCGEAFFEGRVCACFACELWGASSCKHGLADVTSVLVLVFGLVCSHRRALATASACPPLAPASVPRATPAPRAVHAVGRTRQWGPCASSCLVCSCLAKTACEMVRV